MFRLIQRSSDADFTSRDFQTLDEAVWASRESIADFLIEQYVGGGLAPRRVVKYRFGQFELIWSRKQKDPDQQTCCKCPEA
jgi:hypothetical protein